VPEILFRAGCLVSVTNMQIDYRYFMPPFPVQISPELSGNVGNNLNRGRQVNDTTPCLTGSAL